MRRSNDEALAARLRDPAPDAAARARARRRRRPARAQRVAPVAMHRLAERVHPPAHLEPEPGRAPVLVHRVRELVLGCSVGQRRARVGERERDEAPPGQAALHTRPRQPRDHAAGVVHQAGRREVVPVAGRPAGRATPGGGTSSRPRRGRRIPPSGRRYAGPGARYAYRRGTLAAVVRGACQRDRARVRPALGRIRRGPPGRPRLPALDVAAVPRGRVRATADRALPPRTRTVASPACCRSSRRAACRCCGAARPSAHGCRRCRAPRWRGRSRATGRRPRRCSRRPSQRARERSGARLQVKRAAADLDGLVAERRRRPWRVSYVLSLPDDESALRFGNSRNHGRIKWAVNKAAQGGCARAGRRRLGRRPRLVSALSQDDARGGRPAAPAATLRGDVERDGPARADAAVRRRAGRGRA